MNFSTVITYFCKDGYPASKEYAFRKLIRIYDQDQNLFSSRLIVRFSLTDDW